MRRLILILDGFGYGTAKEFVAQGGFKGFQGPAAVVAPYPSMTDLCIQDLLGGESCEALEARYFDKQANRLRGGKIAYLFGQNQPYRKKIDYCGAAWIDALCYVAPWTAFKHEMRRLQSRLAKAKSENFVAYLVSTAGIGTKYGQAGQNMCLERIDSFFREQLTRRPDLRITLVSDHGHSYVASAYFDIRHELKRRGWTFAKKLRQDKDLVYPAFGLVHCAGFHTTKPDELADDLRGLACTEIVSYLADDKVIIKTAGGQGKIWPNPTGYSYLNIFGDPLRLDAQTGETLQIACNGWLDKSIVHHYPCAPERLWRAHTKLVKNTPDVILALKDGYFFGSRILGRFAHVESTHGGLNRSNSLAFCLDNKRKLPQSAKSSDILKAG